MLGGGSFTAQNKTLPGSYINFVSAAQSTAVFSERGIAAVPMVLNWGPEKQIFEVTAEAFQKDCRKLFGYSYEAAEMRDLRELFLNLNKGVFYRLNSGAKAANDFAEANCGGSRGNDLTIVIAVNVNDESRFDVKTLLANHEVDRQTVAAASELQANDYVSFKGDATLAATAGTPLTGGANGAELSGADHADFLTAAEAYRFHVLCCPAKEDEVKALYTAFTKRMRDEAGVKFQTVVHQYEAADYEGVISVENETHEKANGLVYWVAGAAASCAVNKTNENKKYNGEYTVKAAYTQAQLSEGIKAGSFMLHKVGDEIRVLMDINTLTTYGEEKGSDFSSNQTVRVLDQIGNDVASMFNDRYLGRIPNDEAGRISLWNDIVTYGKQLSAIRAIQAVASDQVVVEAGSSKRSVVVGFPVTPIHCMSQLYMTVIVQ